MTTTDLETTCPHCGRTNPVVTGRRGTRPAEGDASICWKCAGIGIFTGDGGVRLATEAETAEITADPRVQTALAAIRSGLGPLQVAQVTWGST